MVVDEDGDLADVPIEDVGDRGRAARPTGGRDLDEPAAPSEPQPGSSRPPQTQQPQQPRPPRTQPPPATEEPPPPPPEVPASPPGAPAGVTATAGDATATVTWGPAAENRSAVTGYRITWAGGGTTVAGTARTATVPGLANGTSYVFTVSAVNGAGTGPGAASNPVTPVAPARPAGAPTALQVLINGGRALFDWDAPADMGTGTFTHYTATMTGQPDAVVTGPAAGFDVDAATPGTLTFTVRVVTTTADGQQLLGPVATTTKVVSGGTVTVGRGPATEEWCGVNDACAWMHVVLTGMRPDTTYHVQPYADDPAYGNEGGECTTDASGYCETDQFAYAGVGHTVWIVATDPDGVDTRSNDYVWTAG